MKLWGGRRNYGSPSSPCCGKGSALLVTLSSPTDKLPLGVVLPHQWRMLSSSPLSITDVLVLDNRPPWVRELQSQRDDSRYLYTMCTEVKFSISNTDKDDNGTQKYKRYRLSDNKCFDSLFFPPFCLHGETTFVGNVFGNMFVRTVATFQRCQQKHCKLRQALMCLKGEWPERARASRQMHVRLGKRASGR